MADIIHVADEIELVAKAFIPTEDEKGLIEIPDVRGNEHETGHKNIACHRLTTNYQQKWHRL